MISHNILDILHTLSLSLLLALFEWLSYGPLE